MGSEISRLLGHCSLIIKGNQQRLMIWLGPVHCVCKLGRGELVRKKHPRAFSKRAEGFCCNWTFAVHSEKLTGIDVENHFYRPMVSMFIEVLC